MQKGTAFNFLMQKDENLHCMKNLLVLITFMWRRTSWKDQKRNISVHYDEHEKPSKKSKSAAHLEKNSDQST